jgi:exosortase
MHALGAVLLALCFFWSYWPTLGNLVERWSSDPQYSHGFLVPCFALVVLWARRGMLNSRRRMPAWPGLGLLAGAVVLRVAAAAMSIEALDAFSILPAAAGTVLFVGGWGLLSWSWPALTFLIFMLPLPYHAEIALAHPLRRIATEMSTYTLQTFGFPALAEGNIIVIGQVRLGVIEACSGLGMLMTFFALATALAMLSRGPFLDRFALVMSAAPIAVLTNVIRITATGIACQYFDESSAQRFMHDLAGWLMMPIALLLLWCELLFLTRLFPPLEEPAHRPLEVPGARKNNRELARALTLSPVHGDFR